MPMPHYVVKTGDLKRRKKYLQLLLLKSKEYKKKITCILPDFENSNEFWKNRHFENLRAGVALRCQDSLKI